MLLQTVCRGKRSARLLSGINVALMLIICWQQRVLHIRDVPHALFLGEQPGQLTHATVSSDHLGLAQMEVHCSLAAL